MDPFGPTLFRKRLLRPDPDRPVVGRLQLSRRHFKLTRYPRHRATRAASPIHLFEDLGTAAVRRYLGGVSTGSIGFPLEGDAIGSLARVARCDTSFVDHRGGRGAGQGAAK